MRRTIAIIAPMIDTSQFNLDFTLRLKRNQRELTLAAFYELASEGFRVENIRRGSNYSEDIPSAGFYLQGLLHLHGYNTLLSNRYDDESLRALGKQDIFAVCVSTTMVISTSSLLALFSSIRKALPGVPVIAGGVSIWKNYFMYANHLEDPHHYPLHPGMLFHPSNAGIAADVLVVAQHGIASLLLVLKELEKGFKTNFEAIPNLCLPGEKGFTFTRSEEEHVDYNNDYTRWDLVDTMPEKIPLRTSIGCPYRCRFCDFCHLFPRLFLRTKASLAEELRLARKSLGNNVALIHVSDDNVFINRKRLFEVCSTIEGSGLNHWVGFMRGGEYDEDELAAIKRSGLRLGMIGVESGDQGQLDRMNKHQKADKLKRGIEQFDAHGISVLMTFIIGFPGETAKSINNTIDFMNSLFLTNLGVRYHIYPLLLFDLSELATPELRKQWRIEGYHNVWSHYSMNSDQALQACFDVFAQVNNVPYNYAEESDFFNRGMFSPETRRSLYQLRHQLTLKLMARAPGDEILPVIRQMAGLMDLPATGLNGRFLEQIALPEPYNWQA